jgi:hypothetical protein
MILPGQRRIYTPDFPQDYQDLVNKLSAVININTQVLFETLNKRVDITNNIDCVVTDVSLEVNASGIPTSTTIFQLTDKIRNIKGLHIIKCENLTNASIYPTAAPFVSWSQVAQGIQIQHVTGLQTGNVFSLRILAYY